MDYFDWYAAYLHRTCPVADGHRDLVTEVYRRRRGGERGVLNEYYKKEFQKSGVNLIFASLFLGADELDSCEENGVFPSGAILKKAMDMLAVFFADLEETKGKVQLVTDKASLLRISAKKGLSRRRRVGVLLYLEGLDMLEGEPELLRCFYAMGVRGAALTWNARRELANVFAKGCGETEAGFPPITDKGVQALLLMEQLGIFVDSSHLSREAAWLLPAFTKKAYVATHSNAAAVKEHERNLTEDEIGEIAGRGGVIGVKLCDQILHLIEAAGEDHVGFGLDLGEGNLLADYRELPALTAELLRRGLSVETVKKILGLNWIRYLLEIFQI